jgi:hypothetical protein
MALPASIIATSYPDGRTVYHRGTLFDGVIPAPAPAYQVGANSVPPHSWNARWTDRAGKPIKVNKTPAQIVAANRMFPFGDTGCKVGGVADYQFAGPMDWAGITRYMPQTGERPDIGLLTDPSALYMLGGSPGPMLAWAQAAGSCPMHFRDETTGKPIDLLRYPQANCSDLPDLQGRPYLLKGPPDPVAPQYSGFDGGWGVQQAHFCEMSYVAYMATGDIGFLEDLQYEANFMVLTNASASTPLGAVVAGELRGIAWSFRQLFMAHIATKDAEAAGPLPDSCQPSSYFKKLLDQSLAYYTKIAADPKNQTFRLLNEFGRFSPWTVDYFLLALAFGVLTGHADWEPLYLWCLGNAIARTNGKSGFPPGTGTPYRLSTNPGGDTSKPQFTWQQAFDALVGDPEVALTQAQHDALIANPLNGGKSFMNDSDDYMQGTRAVLTVADYLDKKGMAAVRKTYPDFDTSLQNAERMFLANRIVNPRVSVVSVAPTTNPPPPAKEITMGKSFTVAPGQHVHLPLTWDDGAGEQSLPPTGITYSVAPDGLVTLTPDATGVDVLGVSAGNPVVTVHDDAGHTDTSAGTVTLPLAGAVHLNA